MYAAWWYQRRVHGAQQQQQYPPYPNPHTQPFAASTASAWNAPVPQYGELKAEGKHTLSPGNWAPLRMEGCSQMVGGCGCG
eukprot:NODE_1687_length_1092_cov_51.412272_g1374_i0.p5 GENE.NODE_1687_length_1092_cov_51.412272_g1374_i0~~NODE_1687_length_1092_cov_51.412272_g1374_i0.p5  ORF type:complete len:81 (+),score=22.86 NODE_1687_length_1092_cov_51.412272_g1374_i0:529-771(+)